MTSGEERSYGAAEICYTTTKSSHMPESFPFPGAPNQEQPPSPFETWLTTELPKEYEQRAKTLDRLGLLRILPESGTYGILDEKGQECSFPELEDIKARILENKELFEKKSAQGFTRLQITPFGLPLKRLFDTLKKETLKNKQAGTLLAANGDPLELDENDPLSVWEGYANEEIRYFPTVFEGMNGKTKQEFLTDPAQSFPGFLVSFIEENLTLPREGKGRTIGGRKQLETNQTPIEYRKLLAEDPQYQGESGLTIEEWITLFLTTLDEEHEVIDDYQGGGSISWNLGTWFPRSGFVSYAGWDRGYRQSFVLRVDAGDRGPRDGVRPAVRVPSGR
jgi:hypothetical protein